jgi:prepilin-type N-terminal cleavage/methylation domain-containing protein
MRRSISGFTLIELLVAAAASLILVGTAFGSLLTFQQMSKRVDDKLVQEAELNRALNFITRDIQTGKSVEGGAPDLPDYRKLFQVVRPDGSIIGYYTARKKKVMDWSGPHIIFRKDFGINKKTGKVDYARALIDQIASDKPTNCPNSADTLFESEVGFSVRINSQKTKATVCIVSDLADSSDVLEASLEATVRAP